MKKALYAASGLLLLISTDVFARGVSPYLPLNLDPTIERQIERVLILADKPALTRPFAAATVLDALSTACPKDPLLCQQVRRYLERYVGTWAVTEVSLEAATSSGATHTLPNRYGLTTDSSWVASAQGLWQPYDHALLSLGAVANEGNVNPQGSLISLGWDRAQLDLGYRARWLSPFVDSGMLSSTNAETMPSVTISNYVPLTRWGFHYEAFVASMDESDRISYGGTQVSGRPRLSGLHLSVEPASGWAIGVNRLMQYGGGPRPSSLSALVHAFFSPSRYDNTNPNLSSDEQFGNQLASISTELIFPRKVPFSVYFEYAGEDTSAGKNYLLGNSALSAGIHFPRLWQRFDLAYEVSEWQNAWYVNNVYGDGLTVDGHIIGHWGGDDRRFGDGVGAQSHSLRVGWDPQFGGTFQLQLRTLKNETYSTPQGAKPYERAYDATVRYSYPLQMFSVGAEVFAGRNVFGDDFSRVAAFIRYDGESRRGGSDSGSYDFDPGSNEGTELFVEAGPSFNEVRIDLDGSTPPSTERNTGAHIGLGGRREVSDRSDLGARIEVDDVDGHTLLSVRALDYRYRFHNPLALSVFLGASRYDLATPAFGLYFGAGLQWRNIFDGWDIGVESRTAKKVARDHLLSDDPSSALRPDSFYTVQAISVSVSKRF